MFGRATIRLGIGPHSSSPCFTMHQVLSLFDHRYRSRTLQHVVREYPNKGYVLHGKKKKVARCANALSSPSAFCVHKQTPVLVAVLSISVW